MRKLMATAALAAICSLTAPLAVWADEQQGSMTEQTVSEPEKATPETGTGEQSGEEQSPGVDETPTDPEDPVTDPKDPPKEDPKDPPKEDPKDPPEDPGDDDQCHEPGGCGEDPPDGCDRPGGCEPPPCENDCGPPPCENDCGPPPCEVNCGPTPPPPVHTPTPGGSATMIAPCDPWSADVLPIDPALREKVAVAYANARASNGWPTVLVSNDRVTGLNYGDTSGADYVGKIPTLDGGDATHICVKPADSNEAMKYLTN